MTRVAINGFGRIGRAFFKLAITRPELEITAINDLGNLENLAYLLKYDSVYGRSKFQIVYRKSQDKQFLVVDDREYIFLQEKDPAMLPWGALEIDIVVEATGAFDTFERIAIHKQAGAKRVVLTAPAKDDDSADAKTVLMGVNEDDLKTCTVSSNGSCTTNSASPVMQILAEKLGVKKAFLNTVHSYTATQSLIDGPARGRDMRRGRAAAANISPSGTGAAISVARAVKGLKNKFNGVSIRVPTLTGSLSCIVFCAEKPTTVEEINNIFKEAEKEERWQGILKTTDDQIVSSDIVGDSCAAIVDLGLTNVVDGDLCAVFSWYDNEFGYTNTLVKHVLKVADSL